MPSALSDMRDLLARIEGKLAEVRYIHARIDQGGMSAGTVRIRLTDATDCLDQVDAILERARFDGLLPKR